jgi:tetratricopeptide repeat protein
MADSIDTVPTRLLEAAACFDSKGDTHNAARAYYYAGIQTRQKGDYGKAIICFLKAGKRARKENNNLRLALIYRGLADTYDPMMDWVSALQYYLLSYEEFKKAGDKDYTGFALIDIARACYATAEYDRSLLYADSAMTLGCQTNDTSLMCAALRRRGEVYTERKNYSDAALAYQEILSLGTQYLYTKDLHNLGIAYVNLGDMGKARQCLESASHMDPFYPYLEYGMARAEGDCRKALEALEEITTKQNQELIKIWFRNNALIISDYYVTEERRAEQEIDAQRKTNYLKNLFLTLFIIFAVVIAFLYARRMNRRHARMKLYISNLSSGMEEAEHRFNLVSHELTVAKSELYELHAVETQHCTELLLSHLNHLKSASLTLEMPDIRDSQRKKAEQMIKTVIEQFREPGFIQKMARYIDTCHEGIYSAFITDFPRLTQRERSLFIYICLGLSPLLISLIYTIPVDAVYNRKKRLKKKIEISSSDRIYEYLQQLH